MRAGGGGNASPRGPRAQRAAPPPTVFWRLFSKKRKEVGHFVKQNGGGDACTRDKSRDGAYFRVTAGPHHVTYDVGTTFDPEDVVHHFV